MISPSKLGRYHHLDSRGEQGEIDSGGVEGFVKNEKKNITGKKEKITVYMVLYAWRQFIFIWMIQLVTVSTKTIPEETIWWG